MLKQGECRAIVSSNMIAAVRECALPQSFSPTKSRFIVQLVQTLEDNVNNAVCIHLNEKQTHELRDFLNSI